MNKLSKKIVNILEKMDFYPNELEKQGNEYYVEMNCATPLGEDWWETIWFDGTPKGFCQSLRWRAYTFDVDEEVEIWVGMRGKNGVPSSIRALVEDAEWKERRLIDLADMLQAEVISPKYEKRN